ncbi:putative Methyltransferase FkbM family [Thiocapsa sp. KS1]|nr:FkbM family methyltransferase [Thiocapsa sp. KS1]CRI66975.1 putative Methyltransferase FkbM family [Thiocapsa sp. KS1]
MSVTARLLLFTRDRAKDIWSIPSLNIPVRQKFSLLKAYLHILVMQYVVSKFMPVKKISFLRYQVETPDWYSFFYIFREIFLHGIYAIPKGEQPPRRIVDCGANIGMAVLFYKWLWPNVTIEAYEPDPSTFEVLKRNIERNKLDSVTLHNKAVSSSEGSIRLYSNPTQEGSGKNTTVKERVSDDYVPYDVPCVDISTALEGDTVDILKMDIEGAEYDVLSRIVEKKKLGVIKHYIVEYHHNITDSKHTLSDFLKLLDSDHRVYRIHSEDSLVIDGKNFYQDIMIHAY